MDTNFPTHTRTTNARDDFDRCANPHCGHTFRDHNPHPERGCLNCLCPCWDASRTQHEQVTRAIRTLAQGFLKFTLAQFGEPS